MKYSMVKSLDFKELDNIIEQYKSKNVQASHAITLSPQGTAKLSFPISTQSRL